MEKVTTLSYLVLLIALSIPILLYVFKDHPHLLGTIKWVMFIVYVLIYLYETILFRTPTAEPKTELSLFWSYRSAISYKGPSPGEIINNLFKGNFSLKPFLNGWAIQNSESLKQVLLNILLTIPLGFMLPVLFPRLVEKGKGKKKRFIVSRVVFIGFLWSLATELTQYIFHIGVFELDDLFNNTLGCFIGCLIYLTFMWQRDEK